MLNRAPYWILNAAGEPEHVDSVKAWSEWYERATRDRSRIVAQHRDEGPDAPDVLVSTVFLGLDHNFAAGGPPVLWETMILGGPDDGYQRRFTSRADALDGHADACRIANATKERERK